MVSGGGHLARIEIKCRVLDSAKIQVNHRARRVKTDQDRCLCASACLIALDRDERHGWGSRYPESRGRWTRQWLKIKKDFEAHSIYSIGTFAISPDEIVTRRDSMGLHRCRLSRARVRVIGGNKMP